jgi:acetyl esterase/lipase
VISGWVDLGLGAAAALNAANALRPLDRRHGMRSMLSWAAGLPTSELPIAALCADLALIAFGVSHRAWESPAGTVGLALEALAAVGLAALVKSSRTVAPVLEKALTKGLSGDYRGALTPTVGVRLPGVLRTFSARKKYLAEHDVAYGPHGDANTLDIWRRRDLPLDGRAPVLINVFGGAWSTGKKQGQAQPLLAHLCEQGWICVSISYRLSPRSTWPDQIVDVKRAIAWVRQNIASHGGDPDHIAISGGSSGGQLSALAALTPDDKQWQPGFEDADTSVFAAVPFYGPSDLTGRRVAGNDGLMPHLQEKVVKQRYAGNEPVFESASPLNRVGPHAPPMMLVHGTNDSLIPVEHGRALADALRAVSKQPVVYAELPRAQHLFDALGSLRANATAEAVARFLSYVRATSTSRDQAR